MTAKKEYEGMGGDEFGRFDKTVDQVMSVPYEELQRRMKTAKKEKARKKRAKAKSSGRGVSRDSGEV